MIKSMPPIVGKNPRVLILGSMPGKESLRAQRYYNNAQNRFWPLLFCYFKSEPTENYDVRKTLLFDNGIALWDVIKHCERESSLDSDIKNSVPNDIADFVRNNGIKAIFLNGRKAQFEFNKHFQSIIEIPAVLLPSTSPANCTISKQELYAKWTEVLDKFLGL